MEKSAQETISSLRDGWSRRAFLFYLERERAHPCRPFLHYNAWWDICWPGVPLDEAICLDAVRGFGEQLIRPYGVIMDSMVIDDGWDDPKTLWQFNQGFPRGFGQLQQLCRQYGTRVGAWLSPFGGYGRAKQQRLEYGQREGYEMNRAGSYADGSGSEYILDTEAMRQLMLELRRESPDLFINLTTGSWPSPFWLRYCDSLWRQGEDTSFAGKGTPRQALLMQSNYGPSRF